MRKPFNLSNTISAIVESLLAIEGSGVRRYYRQTLLASVPLTKYLQPYGMTSTKHPWTPYIL